MLIYVCYSKKENKRRKCNETKHCFGSSCRFVKFIHALLDYEYNFLSNYIAHTWVEWLGFCLHRQKFRQCWTLDYLKYKSNCLWYKTNNNKRESSASNFASKIKILKCRNLVVSIAILSLFIFLSSILFYLILFNFQFNFSDNNYLFYLKITNFLYYRCYKTLILIPFTLFILFLFL